MTQILLAVTAVLVATGNAAAFTLDEVLSRLEKAEKEVRSLSFRYTQETRLEATQTDAAVRGRAQFRRPNLFRVEQGNPPTQVVISDGKNLWMYMPERGQAIRDSMDNWSRSAGFPQGLTPFRMDVRAMRKAYDFKLERPGGEGVSPVLVLTPKETGPWPYTLRLWVDMASGLASRTELSASSVSTVITVSEVRVNPDLPDDTFTFRPPPGVDVMDMPLQ